MVRARYAVDAEELFVKLVAAAMTQCDVRAEPDVDSVENLPMIIVSPGQGQAVGSQRGTAWEWTTHFSVLDATEEEASEVADELYEKLNLMANSWDPAVGMIEGVGAIINVEDISMFSRTVTTVTPAGGLTQFDGTFAITVRKS